MSKLVEIEKLDRAIKDSEIRLNTVNTNVVSLTREIDQLISYENQLIQNIKFLKKQKIVALAAEFKKIREDMGKTKTRLIALKNDREHFVKAANDVIKLMKKQKEDLKKLKESGDNNVLLGKFGKKHDG